jgi:hypothetical protein
MFSLLRSLCWFTALGFLTLALIGPTMAVVGTLLPFALIGALVWTGWRMAKRLVGRLRGKVPQDLAALNVLPQVGRGAQKVLQQGIQQCKTLGPVVCQHVQDAGEKVVRGGRAVGYRLVERGRAIGHRLVEAFYGGLTGALLAWAAVGAADETMGVGAAVGAVAGFLISRPKRQPAGELVAAR